MHCGKSVFDLLETHTPDQTCFRGQRFCHGCPHCHHVGLMSPDPGLYRFKFMFCERTSHFLIVRVEAKGPDE